MVEDAPLGNTHHVEIQNPRCYLNEDGIYVAGFDTTDLVEDVSVYGGCASDNTRYGVKLNYAKRVFVSPETELKNNTSAPFNVYASSEWIIGCAVRSHPSVFMGIGATSTVTLDTAGRVYLTPIIIKERCWINKIYFYIDSVSAGNLTAGIYRDNGATPGGGPLVVESASVAAAGTYRVQAISIALTELTPGLYWVGIESDSTTVVTDRISPSGLVHANFLTEYYYDRSGGYGAFTDPCPTPTALTTAPCYIWVGYQ